MTPSKIPCDTREQEIEALRDVIFIELKEQAFESGAICAPVGNGNSIVLDGLFDLRHIAEKILASSVFVQ